MYNDDTELKTIELREANRRICELVALLDARDAEITSLLDLIDLIESKQTCKQICEETTDAESQP